MITRYDPSNDEEFIYSAILNSYAESDHVKSMPRAMYFALLPLLIDRLIERSTILVYRGDSTKSIRGFVIGEVREGRAIVHAVYVKSERRRKRIATALLGALSVKLGVDLDGGAYTLFRYPGARVLESLGMTFQPYFLGENRK